ncbi:MAG: hypothetical protein JJE37_14620 [Methyloceanibacter sp.]|jgi:hypothetical protein|nr:hypothetical protein [Methyloceanibacter sp.]
MTTLATVFRTLIGLFVDDGALALSIIVVVLLSWIFTALFTDLPLAAGAVLLVGALAVLIANVMTAAER